MHLPGETENVRSLSHNRCKPSARLLRFRVRLQAPISALMARLCERAKRAHKPPLTEEKPIGHISLRCLDFRWTTE
jgi:hypothetical protein